MLDVVPMLAGTTNKMLNAAFQQVDFVCCLNWISISIRWLQFNAPKVMERRFLLVLFVVVVVGSLIVVWTILRSMVHVMDRIHLWITSMTIWIWWLLLWIHCKLNGRKQNITFSLNLIDFVFSLSLWYWFWSEITRFVSFKHFRCLSTHWWIQSIPNCFCCSVNVRKNFSCIAWRIEPIETCNIPSILQV